jgi:hypothetical protein
MAASSRLMIAEAERRFPVRIKIGVPEGGLGERLNQMHRWLDENCGADGWVMTPTGFRGVINDAVAVYFLDVVLAGAFVARWCAGARVEVAEGAFRVREDAPRPGLASPRTARPDPGSRAALRREQPCRLFGAPPLRRGPISPS